MGPRKKKLLWRSLIIVAVLLLYVLMAGKFSAEGQEGVMSLQENPASTGLFVNCFVFVNTTTNHHNSKIVT